MKDVVAPDSLPQGVLSAQSIAVELAGEVARRLAPLLHRQFSFGAGAPGQVGEFVGCAPASVASGTLAGGSVFRVTFELCDTLISLVLNESGSLVGLGMRLHFRPVDAEQPYHRTVQLNCDQLERILSQENPSERFLHGVVFLGLNMEKEEAERRFMLGLLS